MKIVIKKRSQTGWLLWFILMMPFMLGTLNGLLGLPHGIRYLIDLAWAALVIYLVRACGMGRGKNTKSILLWVMTFFVVEALVYPTVYQSSLYFVWGVRNNIRFYMAFLGWAMFLRTKDIEDYLDLFDKLFWINVLVSFFQFFVLGIYRDDLGGIFGITVGCNSYTNVFMTIIVTKSIILYLLKKEKTSRCALKCLAALCVAALAEIKFFFAEFILIVLLAVMFTDFTWRKFWVITGGLLAVAGCAALLVVVFPSFEGFLSLEAMYNAAVSDQGYTSSGDLNRLNAIPQINNLWLTEWKQRIFGLGMGNCDTSNVAILNTPFYLENGDMHYTWLSYAFMYLECGWVGLIFHFGFFGIVFFQAWKIGKHLDKDARPYCLLARIMAVCCMLISIYNSSLRTEAGYMAYFVMAMPFVLEREKWHKGRGNKCVERTTEKCAVQRKSII